MVVQLQSAGWSYRLGRSARRALRGYSRSERQMANWLASNGMPSALAWGVVWAVRLAVAGVLFYTAFWVALLLLFGVAAVSVAQHAEWDEDEEPELRNGHSGFGLYNGDDIRIDPYDQSDQQT